MLISFYYYMQKVRWICL